MINLRLAEGKLSLRKKKTGIVISMEVLEIGFNLS